MMINKPNNKNNANDYIIKTTNCNITNANNCATNTGI